MKVVHAHLKSASPYSQSKYIVTPREDKEGHDAHEKRCWKERCHVNDDGYVFIPPMAFKKSIAQAAAHLGIRIPGRNKKTWKASFVSGILVVDPLVLPVKIEDVKGEWLFVPSDGRPGGGSRVMKCFPLFKDWEGMVTYHLLDDLITKDAFEYHCDEAGKFVGVGRFRPERGGYYGRWTIESFEWEV